MSASKQLELTLDEFNRRVPRIKTEIQKWYEANKDAMKPEDGIDDGWSVLLPVIDSKMVVHTSPIFEENLGRKLKAEMIQKGGYESCEKMSDDLIGKFKEEIFGGKK